MKRRRFFAGMTAAAMAVSMMATFSVSAAQVTGDYEVSTQYLANDVNNRLFLSGDEEKGEGGPFNDSMDLLSQYVGYSYIVAIDETLLKEALAPVIDEDTGEYVYNEDGNVATKSWIVGGIGRNASSITWQEDAMFSISRDESGDLVYENIEKLSYGKYAISFYTEDVSEIFDIDDIYAQLWLSDWSEYKVITDVLGATLHAESDVDEDMFRWYENDDGTVSIQGYYGSESAVNIPAYIDGMKVTKIGYQAFRGNETIRILDIPSTVTDIDTSAFFQCPALSRINVSVDNTVYSSENGILFNKDKSALIRYPQAKSAKSYKVPYTVKSIEDRAFQDCTSLEAVTIPRDVTKIGSRGFSGCSSLKSVNLPEGLESISYLTFDSCTSLKTIEIPESVKSVGEDAFSNTAVVNSQTGDVKYVDNWIVEADKNVTRVYTKEGTRGIADWVFRACLSLESVTLHEGLYVIGRGAFDDCRSLKSIAIPETCEILEESSLGYYYALTEYGERSARSAGGDLTKMDDFLIYCYSYTAALQYAKDNGFDYYLMDDEACTVYGDVELESWQDRSNLKVTAVNSSGKSYDAEVSGSGYFFRSLPSGDYTLIISCDNYASKIYSITHGTMPNPVDSELKLYGDINGDGKISILDIVKANAAVKETSSLDEYDSMVADVNSDGKLSIVDVVKMNAHMKGKSSLW